MTCIVGVIENGVTYIGSDSIGSNGYSGTIRKDKKVFKLKDTSNGIVGFTSSFRMGQLLMYRKGLIDPRDEQDGIDHEYLVTKFIPNVIHLFEEGGYSRNNSGEKEGGIFLLGYKDRLYKIESDFQVAEPTLSYEACGSGESYALGSLHSTEGLDLSVEDRIHKALRAASNFSVSVQGPFYILNTANDNVVMFEN